MAAKARARSTTGPFRRLMTRVLRAPLWQPFASAGPGGSATAALTGGSRGEEQPPWSDAGRPASLASSTWLGRSARRSPVAGREVGTVALGYRAFGSQPPPE